MTNKTILNVIKGLSELEELDLPLNIRLSYSLARDRQILNSFAEIINNKQVDIYKKYGDKVDRTSYKVPDDKMDIVEAELNELLNIENEVDLMKVKVDDFGENSIPFYVIEKLLPIIEE